MRVKNKPWALPFIDDHPSFIKNENTCVEIFENYSRFQSINLEIGCGKGQFLVQKAAQNPFNLYIGVEKVPTVLAIAGKKVKEENLNNVFLILGDVERLFSLFPLNTFQNIYLNFSDPWPKSKHAKRRLTAERFLDFYEQILVDGGQIHQKTDNPILFASSQKMFEKSSFKFRLISSNYDTLLDGDVMSEYEEAFRLKNQPIYKIIVEKRPQHGI